MTNTLRIAALALALSACRSEVAGEEEAFARSAPSSPVVDEAELLPEDVEAALDKRLRDYWDEERTAIVVNTVPDLGGQSIEAFAFDRFNSWGIGAADTNRGVLVVIARDDRRARIEVGCGLETVLTNPVAQDIMDNRMIPEFRDGDFVEGIEDAVSALIETLDTSEVEFGPTSPICLEQAA